jgi:hypothetical protein
VQEGTGARVDGNDGAVGNVKGMVRGVCMSFLDCRRVLVNDFCHASQSDDVLLTAIGTGLVSLSRSDSRCTGGAWC